METWKVLLITLILAIVIGCIAGMMIGRYLQKRSRSDYKPLLSIKEKIIYLVCLVLGTACILFGLFYSFPGDGMDMVGQEGDGDMPMEEGAVEVMGEPGDGEEDPVPDDGAKEDGTGSDTQGDEGNEGGDVEDEDTGDAPATQDAPQEAPVAVAEVEVAVAR